MTDHPVVQAILLGILEGLTEFVPVSSTGHLILASELLGFTEDSSVAFKIAIQFGAILAILFAYRARFWNVATGLVRWERGPVAFTRNILLGFLPAVIIGILAYDAIRVMLETPFLVSVMLVLGGIAILLIDRGSRRVRVTDVETMPARVAGQIGVVQCLAMVPGVSRSGATIMGSLLMGVDRRTAAEYSFFLAVPTMLGATVYALWKERDLLTVDGFWLIVIGFWTAFAAALVVVRALLVIVSRYGFAPFAWYRIAVGLISGSWLLLR